MAGLEETALHVEFHEQNQDAMVASYERLPRQTHTLNHTDQAQDRAVNTSSSIANHNSEHCVNANGPMEPFPYGAGGSVDNLPEGREPPLSPSLCAQPQRFGNNTIPLASTIEGFQSGFNVYDWMLQQGERFTTYSEASIPFDLEERHDAPSAFTEQDSTNRFGNPSPEDNQLHMHQANGAQERGWRGYEK